MCSGLAYYLSQKRAPDRIQLLKQLYEDELIRALNEDGSRTSVYISPQSYFPGGCNELSQQVKEVKQYQIDLVKHFLIKKWLKSGQVH